MLDKKIKMDPNQMTKKKTSRKPKAIPKSDKEIDMKKFKEKIQSELSSASLPLKKEEDGLGVERTSNEYEQRYKEYLNEGFTLNCLNFTNRVIIESTTIPQNLRNTFPLHKILIGVVKTLMMNELEIVYLSLYLDKMGWVSNGYLVEDNLLITAISVKIYLNANYEFLFDYLSHSRPNIESDFNKWLNLKKDYCNLMTISPREVNERFKLLNRPFNTYCKHNYIDNNYIVDQILQMSLPYSENNKQHEKFSTCSIDTVYDPFNNVKNEAGIEAQKENRGIKEPKAIHVQNIPFTPSLPNDYFMNPMVPKSAETNKGNSSFIEPPSLFTGRSESNIFANFDYTGNNNLVSNKNSNIFNYDNEDNASNFQAFFTKGNSLLNFKNNISNPNIIDSSMYTIPAPMKTETPTVKEEENIKADVNRISSFDSGISFSGEAVKPDNAGGNKMSLISGPANKNKNFLPLLKKLKNEEKEKN